MYIIMFNFIREDLKILVANTYTIEGYTQNTTWGNEIFNYLDENVSIFASNIQY